MGWKSSFEKLFFPLSVMWVTGFPLFGKGFNLRANVCQAAQYYSKVQFDLGTSVFDRFWQIMTIIGLEL